jgi:hypothetical protein
LAEGRAVCAGDDPAVAEPVGNEPDDSGVNVFVVALAQKHQVRQVGRPVGVRNDVVRVAPSRFATATGDDATAVASDEGSSLPG